VKVRLDKLLVERALVASRERAQAMILAGRVLVNEQKVEKAGASVEDDVAIRMLGDELRYVGRGGLKLERALEHWKIDVNSRTCMDVGASTGGFTDCFLQHGAGEVVAVDTGFGQIDAKLRADGRVHLLERTNARYLTREQVEGVSPGRMLPDIAAMDVSFISATLVLPAVVAVLRASTSERKQLVLLVKPQFEVGRERVGKGGIVRDAAAQAFAVNKVREYLAGLGVQAMDVIDSPVLGAEGNREFLLYAEL
jgi:23S rRNA (cytidine1920-2'-O)/16S rRNA (cytidine1409-2'-O)-methyltransferase